jgi:hypothetical protein
METSRARLSELKDENETASDVVLRLLDAEGSGLGDLPEEARTRFREILDMLGGSLTVASVADAALRMWAKLGAVLGHREGTGLSETQKTKIVSFFEDADPTRTRMRLAIGALQELLRQDEITGLLPYLKSVTEILGSVACKQNTQKTQENEKEAEADDFVPT